MLGGQKAHFYLSFLHKVWRCKGTESALLLGKGRESLHLQTLCKKLRSTGRFSGFFFSVNITRVTFTISTYWSVYKAEKERTYNLTVYKFANLTISTF